MNISEFKIGPTQRRSSALALLNCKKLVSAAESKICG
jgi:hypothetical protein